ncbi:hypothetical protein N665_0017s0037 [Sinapis alba]|nr:hypothetical protein N665_0017s0037 [Sinapis alba]
MDLIFETQRGSSFSIEVGYFDTVLEIKGKIEKYQHIPVPKQTLVFQGNVLQDNHNIEQCDLYNNSRIHLFISSHGNNDQNHSNQVFKPEQSPQANSTEQQIINCHQDSKDIFTNTEQVFQTEQPLVPSNSTEQRSNQVVQTEKSPLMKEVINVPDSPVKVRKFRKPPQRLRVMVLPHSPDNEPVSKVPVSVMANENVEELRKKLEKIRERNELKLPEKGYFFIHKQNVLDDERSFLWNGVAHGDTIEIFPGYVTKDGRTFGL